MGTIGPGSWVQRTKEVQDVRGPHLPMGSVHCVESLTERLGYCKDCFAAGNEPSPGLNLVNVVASAPFCQCGFKPLGGGEKAERTERVREPA